MLTRTSPRHADDIRRRIRLPRLGGRGSWPLSGTSRSACTASPERPRSPKPPARSCADPNGSSRSLPKAQVKKTANESRRSQQDQERKRPGPALDSTDSAASIRPEHPWPHNVRSALEADRRPAQALAKAGPDGVLGEEQFAPSWLVINPHPNSDVELKQVLRPEVVQAFSGPATSPADAAAILASWAAERESQAVQRDVGHHRAGRTLEVALAVRHADLRQMFRPEDSGKAESA